MKKKVGLLAFGTVVGATGVLFQCSGPSPNPPPAGDFIPDSGPTTGAEAGSSSGSPTEGISVTPTDIQFGQGGFVDCGTQATSATVTVGNTTAKAVNFSATITAGADNYSLSPATLSVSPGGTGTITIIPKAIPAKSAVTAEFYSGNVEVRADPSGGSSSSSSGGATGSLGITNVKLHETARGAILVTTAAQTIDFGGAKIGTHPKQTFSVTNNGNAPIKLDFAVGSDPLFSVTPSASLGINETAVQDITFSPTALQSYTDTLTAKVNGATALCDAPLANVNLKGTGTQSIDVQPGNLAFGKVNCGTAAPYQVLTIGNSGTLANFTPTFGKGPAATFTLANDADGSPVPTGSPTAIPASSNFKLRVVPKMVTAPVLTNQDGLADTLKIHTDSTGDVDHLIQITETAQGAYLSLNATTYKVVDGIPSHNSKLNVTVTNSGNLNGDYTITIGPRAGVPPNTFTFGVDTTTGNPIFTTTGSLAANGGNKTHVMETNTPATWAAPACQLLGDIVMTPSGSDILCSDAQPTAPTDLECQ